ncbi:MAG TPA: hypothetical protein VMZ74_16570 [Ramlibacter sp.]|nr:hypothetical protein [Ramlibacter sp.]
MNTTNTSIGRGPASGGNENHDGDPTTKTLGEKVGQEQPAGTESIVDNAAPDLSQAATKAEETFPDGPNVEDSPWELDAARGNTKRD